VNPALRIVADRKKFRALTQVLGKVVSGKEKHQCTNHPWQATQARDCDYAAKPFLEMLDDVQRFLFMKSSCSTWTSGESSEFNLSAAAAYDLFFVFARLEETSKWQ
jgi:hypothetical protein